MDDMEAQLKAMADKIAEIKAFMAPLDDAEKNVLMEEQALRETFMQQMNAINERKQKINSEKYNKQQALLQEQQKLKQMQYEIETKKRAEEEAKRAAVKEAEEKAQHAALVEKWDKLTAAAPWRELAKEHQITGAHRILEDRYVILADPMGLGKTLTSIIVTDMAYAATKLASKSFPFLGIKKNVWVSSQWYYPEDYHKPELAGKPFGGFASTDQVNAMDLKMVKGHYEDQIVNGIERPVGKRILYICPNSLLRNVMSEFRMWAPHRNVTSVGGMTRAEKDFVFEFVLKNQTDYVVVCNFEAWRKDMSLIDKFCDLDFDTVIIDEAHNAKDVKSITFRGIDRILKTTKPEFIIPMTGTPVLNRPQELWTLLHMVNPDDFYDIKDFLYQFCQQDDEAKWYFQPGGLERLAKRIRNNFMRRTKDEAGVKLPEKTIIHHDLEVDEDTWPEQARVRKQMRDYATIMIDEQEGKAISAAALIAMFTRLRQIETWPAGIQLKDKHGNVTEELDVRESQKIDYVIRRNEDGDWDGLIPEAIDDERMVLFSQFKAPLEEIANRCRLAGYRPVVLDGSTSADLKDEIHRDFDARYTADRADSKWDIVLCNYRVGGVGLNLTSATQLITLDEEWNPGKRDQAYDRIHRIGQEKPVTIHVIRNQKTIDDWLGSIMDAKEAMVEGFESAMISAQDFKDAMDSGLL